MRDVPFEFEGGASRLCRVFVIRLVDDRRFAFTDHDRPLPFDGLTCRPMDAADTERRTGFDADSGAVRALFDIDLDADAIRDGALDGAVLEEWMVDASDPTRTLLLTRGRLGGVTYGDAGFEADWLGQSTLLERSTGRVFSRRCDAELGDSRCGVDMAGHPPGTVCPRTFEACRDTFGNAENFRGFPYIIGDDALQAGVHLTPSRDGGSRYA